jgi:hypothetical protein
MEVVMTITIDPRNYAPLPATRTHLPIDPALLDREADLLLSEGRAASAERLSHLAADLRAEARS